MGSLGRTVARATPFLLTGLAVTPALATDITGVWPASLDLPRVYALLEDGEGTVLSIDPNDESAFIPIWAFLDTGASGIVIGPQTRDLLQVPQAFHGANNDPIVFGDVGVGGTHFFDVSENLTLKVAPQHPTVDPYVIDGDYTVFNSHTTGVRAQLGIPTTQDPPSPVQILLDTVDVIGMPAIRNKVMVMDPTPVNNVLPLIEDPNAPIDDIEDIFIRTSLYDASDTNAPIPATSRTVKLSYAFYDQYTTITPAGAEGPLLWRNPMIGPSPVPNGDGMFNDAPGVKLAYGGNDATASLLLDTGGSVSAISTAIAQQLGVTYDPNNPFGSENPVLLGVPVDEQFTTSIAGIGGEITIAGFFLNSLLLRTEEGNLLDDLDPNHLRFLDAPVFVFDITLQDPDTLQTLTLDGILGMNFLSASTLFESDGTSFAFLAGRESPFSALVFDESAGELRLELAAIPEPGASALLCAGALGLLAKRRQRCT